WPVQCGLGPTPFAAEAAGRFTPQGAEPVIGAHELGARLGRLPVAALPITPALKERFARFGIERLDALAKLDPAAVAAQFGPEGRTAWEFAHGRDPRAFTPYDDEPPLAA